MDLFRKVLWRNSCLCCLEICSSVHRLAAAARSTRKHFTDTPAVQFSRVRLATVVTQPSRDSQASALAQVSRRDQQGTPGEVLGCVSAQEAKISKDVIPTSVAQIAVPASQALSPSISGVLFIPSKHHVPSTRLASALASNHPKSLEATRNCSTPPEVFGCISLYDV